MFSARNFQQALVLYKKILAIDALNITALNSVGLIFLSWEKFAQSAQFFKQALKINPQNIVANSNLGFILAKNGEHQQALEHYQVALMGNPHQAYLWCDMGHSFSALENFEKAIECYKKAVRLDKNFIGAYLSLGKIYKKDEKYPVAIYYFKKILELEYKNDEAWLSLALIEVERKNFADAVEYLNKALVLFPDNEHVYLTLGSVAVKQEKFQDAIDNYKKAVVLNPNCMVAYEVLACIHFKEISDLDAASYYTEKALLLNPKSSMALKISAALEFFKGNLYEGFKKHDEIRHVYIPLEYNLCSYNFFQKIPRWNGGVFSGKRLVIGDNQGQGGHGDFIQFCRYFPLVKEYGGDIIVPVPESLIPLLKNFKGIDELFPWTVSEICSRSFDLHIPLIALPTFFNISLTNILNKVPYISVCPELDQIWKTRLIPDNNLKVGLVWGGSKVNSTRNCHFKALAPLNNVKGVTYYSLQLGWAAKECLQNDFEFDIVNLTDSINSFADTAALVNNLDLVISIDTSVPHLAGALAKPVWLMLSFVAEWRWCFEENTSPWYPTMRIFRSKIRGDWSGVIKEVCANLEIFKMKKDN